jgi:putative Mg2+ transporter-C (MgtC) family protein
MIINESFLIGLTLAGTLSAVIGLEREITGQPAGIRTHLILGIGAALASMLSIAFSKHLANPAFPSDPGRIVAQVVSGVGFLGGGAILRYGVNIKGLTTASSLWTTAIIGIACGAGFYVEACFTTVFVITALVVVDKIVKKALGIYTNHEITIRVKDRPGIINDIRQRLDELECKVLLITPRIEKNNNLEITIAVRKPKELSLDKLIKLVQSVSVKDA